jgi:hypothetical protein
LGANKREEEEEEEEEGEEEEGEGRKERKKFVRKGVTKGKESGSRRRRKYLNRQPVGLLYTSFVQPSETAVGKGHVFSVTPAGQNSANSLHLLLYSGPVHRPKDLQFAFCSHAAWHSATVS